MKFHVVVLPLPALRVLALLSQVMLLLSGQSVLCGETCPAKDKSNVYRKALNMADQLPIYEVTRANYSFVTAAHMQARKG